jgi:hypothetical protein
MHKPAGSLRVTKGCWLASVRLDCGRFADAARDLRELDAREMNLLPRRRQDLST